MQPSDSAPVTLRAIAARAGVSHVTVSLALRDEPRIPKERRESIQLLAKEMGYRPDPMLHALNQYRRTKSIRPVTHSLAWINRWEEPGKLREHQEFEEYWQGASSAARALGYTLEEFREAEGLPPGKLQKVLWTRGIRGVIIPPHPTQLDWGKFDFMKFTGVSIGYSQATPRLHRTSSDQIGHTMLAWEKMTDLGYRRIGFLGQASPTRRFISGFLHSQQSVPSAQRVPPLMLPPGSLDSHSQAMARWSARHKPDAILSDFRDSLMMCRMAGLDVPKTIGLAVLSVRDGGADAGIDQHPAEIGMTAVRELFSLMHTRQQGIPAIPHATLVSGTWVDGDSLPRRSTASKS